MNYQYLVISALQEELEPFNKLISPSRISLDLDVKLAKVNFQNNLHRESTEILLYSPNKMGMPYNAAKLIQIILHFNPKYVFFIGICAGLKEYDFGSVLIPKRIFAYESGKYKNGEFLPDYQSYETSDSLRNQSVSFYNRRIHSFPYKVIIDEDFCSGAAVIDDEGIVKKILENGSRKLSGLDMESYSITCINDILKPANQLLVVKGISDKATNKGKAEANGERQKAKNNAADFVFNLIEYLEENAFIKVQKPALRIDVFPNVSNNINIKYKLKIRFTIYNDNSFPVVIESISFSFNNTEMKFNGGGVNKNKPSFYIGRKKDLTEVYKDIIVLNPKEPAANSWIAINTTFGDKELHETFDQKMVGQWTYRCCFLTDNPYWEEHTIKI